MTETIKKRIEAVKKGELPEGYKRTKAGICPNDWNGTVRAKQLFKSHTDKNHNGEQEILASTQEHGIVPRSQIGIDIQCSDEGVKGYKKVSKGDFVISLRSFQGGIEYSEYDGIVSPAYTVLKPIMDISTCFYKYYFKTDSFIKRLNGAVYGIRDGKQIGYQDFGDMYIPCPPLPEQERIAEILNQCDKVIELKQKKIDELSAFKKECLRRLFPAAGSNKPEVRFPGFTDDWEHRKLVDLCSLFTDGDWIESKDQSESGIRLIQTGNIGVTKYLDKSSNKKWINDDTFERLHCTEVLCGDILISRLPDPAGRACIMPNIEQKMITAVDCTIARIAPEYSSEYIVQYLATNVYFNKVNDCLAGGTRQRISRNNLADFMIPLPSSKIEQQQIGAFFKNLDHLIVLHQQELNEYKTYKNILAKLLLTGIVRVSI